MRVCADGLPPALQGLGDDDLASGADAGSAESGVFNMKGVFATDVGAVDVRDMIEAENGVYGDAFEYGEFSSILALFGGTSGGKVLDLSRWLED